MEIAYRDLAVNMENEYVNKLEPNSLKPNYQRASHGLVLFSA